MPRLRLGPWVPAWSCSPGARIELSSRKKRHYCLLSGKAFWRIILEHIRCPIQKKAQVLSRPSMKRLPKKLFRLIDRAEVGFPSEDVFAVGATSCAPPMLGNWIFSRYAVLAVRIRRPVSKIAAGIKLSDFKRKPCFILGVTFKGEHRSFLHLHSLLLYRFVIAFEYVKAVRTGESHVSTA
jgi:hypothetical protein